MTAIVFGSRRALHLIERQLVVYRRIWPILVTGLFEPIFYLLSIGIGLGEFIDTIPGPDGRALDYTTFVAPAMLASSAMNGAVYDSTMNVFYKLKFAKTYDAILATPMSAGDVALGEICWALLRGVIYATVFIGVMLVMGLIESLWGVLALPAAILIGFAFAAVGMAVTTCLRSWNDLEFVLLASLPLFLFSTTFYPLDTYPRALQLVVQCTPLFHGVSMMRALTTGTVSIGILVHVVYLLVMGLIGLAIASRRLEKLLLT